MALESQKEFPINASQDSRQGSSAVAITLLPIFCLTSPAIALALLFLAAMPVTMAPPAKKLS